MPSREPVVAMLDNTLTPYRVHFHRRIAAERRVELLSLQLHAQDFFPWTLEAPGLRRTCFRVRSTNGPRGVLEARRISSFLVQQRVEALVVGGYGDAIRAAIILLAHRAGIPCLLFGDSNARAEARDRLRSSAKRLLLPRLLRRCAAVLVCGRLGREYYRSYGVPDSRIFFSPYEPDYSSFAAGIGAVVTPAAQRMPRERKRLVFVGRFSPEKRADLLLDAFARIAPARPEWDLVLVGDGPLRPWLEAQARPLGERVRFAGFIDDPADMAAVYRCCQVLVLPSDYEPWGVVVNEALASGLALVTSDAVGAAADLLREDHNGLTFPRGDLARLVDALLGVTDPPRLSRFQAASAQVLASWRREADPVQGLDSALASCGVALRDAYSGGGATR